jgi:acetyltransferase-like isoleucine patch superfamily enzyme
MSEKASLVSAVTGGWDYSTLPINVRLGKNCFIERNSSFERYRSRRDLGLVLGDRVKVYTWTTFNIEPEGQLVVGSDSILVGAVFMCAERIKIGERVTISYNVTIADCDFHPLDVDERRRDAVAISPSGDKNDRPTVITQPVAIADDVWIGIGAIILKGVKIGKHARIGAGAVVTRDVPDGAHVFGNPAIRAEDART